MGDNAGHGLILTGNSKAPPKVKQKPQQCLRLCDKVVGQQDKCSYWRRKYR
jgi:hypothetical protein